MLDPDGTAKLITDAAQVVTLIRTAVNAEYLPPPRRSTPILVDDNGGERMSEERQLASEIFDLEERVRAMELTKRPTNYEARRQAAIELEIAHKRLNNLRCKFINAQS